MADLSINIRDYTDSTDTQIITVAPLVRIDINSGTYSTACQSSALMLKLDKAQEYFEISVNNKNIYRYVKGDTLNGGAIADAEAMHLAVIALIS